jgi:pimeloyl-ACP methyl ester carboxylesterase
MREIIFPELVIALLLLIPVIRPFVKGLRPQAGLVWLPPIGLALCIALFPAYGFRPECIPLLIFAFVMNVRNRAALTLYVSRSYHELFPEQDIPAMLTATLALACVTGVGLWFSPAVDTALISNGIRSVRVQDAERNTELFARVYEHEDRNQTHPIILVVPPELGSVQAVDRLCAELRQAGFTVISYSRPGFDLPALVDKGKTRLPAVKDLAALLQAAVAGTIFEGANKHGRRLEEERQRDVAALLAALDSRLTPGSAGDEPVVLIGYNTGGSALVRLAATPAFISAHPRVKGVIAVESRLLSVYETQPDSAGESPDENEMALPEFIDKLAALWPKPVFSTGALPVPALPTLFLVSDRVTAQKQREGVYGPVLRSLHTSNALLIAVEGAGLLDYTDYVVKYPLFSLFFSGRSVAVWRDEEFTTGTASVMANFAAQVLAEPGTPHRKTALTTTSYLTTGGGWTLANPQYILFP